MYGMGDYLRSGCHIDTGRGLLESTSESRLDTGYIQDSQLPDHILGDEDRILYRVTEEFITFLHTPQSTLIHSFIKPLATYSTMVC